MVSRSRFSQGFTIVELLIVIVVIAVLASITVAVYTGIQERTRDSRRLVDAKQIEKSLEAYKTFNGSYPNEQSSGWERSRDYPATFINDLVTSNTVSSVPVDPINDEKYTYWYYRYPAGSYGCDASRGEFYVLNIRYGEASNSPAQDSPGWQCPNRNWKNEGWYVTGGYTN